MRRQALLLLLAVAGCEGGPVAIEPTPSPINSDDVMVSGLTVTDQKTEVMIMGAPGAVVGASKVRVTRVSTKVTEELTVAAGGSFGSTFEADPGSEFEIVAVSAAGKVSKATTVKAPDAMAPSAAVGDPRRPERNLKAAFTLTDLGGGHAKLEGTVGEGSYAAVSNLTTGAAWAATGDAGKIDLTIDASPCDQVGVFEIDPKNRGTAAPMQGLEVTCPK